jgi:hypothetical protein
VSKREVFETREKEACSTEVGYIQAILLGKLEAMRRDKKSRGF